MSLIADRDTGTPAPGVEGGCAAAPQPQGVVTDLVETGDIAEGSVLAAAIENSPWFAERVRRACEQAWAAGFGAGRSQFRQITENPHQVDGGRPSLPFVP